MKALLYREFRIMPVTAKGIIAYMIFCLAVVASGVIAGPKGLGLFNSESISLYLSIINFTFLNGLVTNNLEQDSKYRQQIYLQTLPVRKQQIVHAKFSSILLLGIAFFATNALMISAYILITDGMWTDIMKSLVMAALYMFVFGIMLFAFFSGFRRLNVIFYTALAFFVGPALLAGFFLAGSGTSLHLILTSGFFFVICIYLLCWLTAAVKMRKSGFSAKKFS